MVRQHLYISRMTVGVGPRRLRYSANHRVLYLLQTMFGVEVLGCGRGEGEGEGEGDALDEAQGRLSTFTFTFPHHPDAICIV